MRGVEARKNLRACFEIVAAEVTRRKMARSSQKARLVASAATSAGLISKHALSAGRFSRLVSPHPCPLPWGEGARQAAHRRSARIGSLDGLLPIPPLPKGAGR